MWNARFARPILLSDCRIIRTLYDVRAFISSLPEDDQRQDKWRGLTGLLAIVADMSDTELVAVHLIDALSHSPFTVDRLENDIPKKPAKASVRKGNAIHRKRIK